MEQSPRAVTWEAPEHHYVKKSGDWYFVLAIIFTSLIISAIFFGNFLFAVLLAVSGFALAIVAANKPSVIPFAVTIRGIRIDDHIHPFASLKSYHIDEEDPRGPHLLVLTKGKLHPLLVIPIPEEYIDDIEAILKDKIKEEFLEEPLFMKVLENFGF